MTDENGAPHEDAVEEARDLSATWWIIDFSDAETNERTRFSLQASTWLAARERAFDILRETQELCARPDDVFDVRLLVGFDYDIEGNPRPSTEKSVTTQWCGVRR